MEGVKQQFVIQEQQYSADSHRDEDSFYSERNGGPAKLSTMITYLLGDLTKQYPFTMQMYDSIASGRSNYKVLKDYRYTYPVISRLDRPSVIAKTNATANLGQAHTEFTLYFGDNRLKEMSLIEGPNNVQARVNKIEKEGSVFKYTCVLNVVSDSATLPAEDATAGAKWTSMFTAVSLEQSRGSKTNTVTPGKVFNQLGVIRKSLSFGDKRNNDRVMNFTMKTEKGTTNSWMSYFLYHYEKIWMEECEHVLWYSKFNRDLDSGKVTLKDSITGRYIPTGAGLLEQIVNYTTYTRLSYNLIADWLTRALFHQQDANGRTVTLYTGRGGIREFDRALKQEGLKVITSFQDVGDKFVMGQGRELGLNGFFDHFYHIDGYMVKVKHNYIFDYGRRANKSARHPETGLPIESYRMVFIDDNMYDGQENINFVSLEKEEMQHAVVLGLTDAPKELMPKDMGSISSIQAPLRSSEVNEGSYHRMASKGVQLVRGNGSFHAEYRM